MYIKKTFTQTVRVGNYEKKMDFIVIILLHADDSGHGDIPHVRCVRG